MGALRHQAAGTPDLNTGGGNFYARSRVLAPGRVRPMINAAHKWLSPDLRPLHSDITGKIQGHRGPSKHGIVKVRGFIATGFILAGAQRAGSDGAFRVAGP